MGMVSMETKDNGPEAYTENPYGYGLCISLSKEQVEALGLEKNPPAAGSSIGIRAIAIVSRVTQEADPGDDDNDVDVCLTLQITDMEITTGETNSSASKALYGGT